MDFDADSTALDPEERGGGDSGEHEGLPSVRHAHTATMWVPGEGFVTLRGGWDILGPGTSPGIHHSEWANRPVSRDGPQDLARRADGHNVLQRAVSSRGPGRLLPVTRKLAALVAGALLVLSLTACMSTEEQSVVGRINALRASVGQPA